MSLKIVAEVWFAPGLNAILQSKIARFVAPGEKAIYSASKARVIRSDFVPFKE